MPRRAFKRRSTDAVTTRNRRKSCVIGRHVHVLGASEAEVVTVTGQ